MIGGKVASLFADLGFRVDHKKLQEFERRMKNTHKRLNATGERVTKDIKRNTKTQLGGLVAVEKRLNKHRGQLWQLRQDYWKTNQEFKRGNISHERRNRLLTEMHTKYRGLQKQARAANREIESNPIRRARRAFNNRPVRGSGGAGGVRSGVAAGGSAALISRAFPAAAVGIGAFAAGAGLSGSNRQFQQFESIRSGLTALEGSAEAANKRLRELAQMAQFYGQPFMQVGEGFKSLANNLKGTAIEDQTMSIFQSLQEYATALGLNQQDLSGIQLAIGQIAAAGKLQGDEINQLAERGVSREKLAQAMGMTLEQFMAKQGTQAGILAKDLLPALAQVLAEQARTGGALESRLTSTQAEQNRALNTAVFANVLANTSGLNQFFQEFYQGLRGFFSNATPLIKELGELFESIGPSAKRNLEAFGELLGSIGNVADSLDGVSIGEPLVTIAEVFNTLSEQLDDAADIINLLRSENSLATKINGITSGFVNVMERIFEGITNALIRVANKVPFVSINEVGMERQRITPTVDLSGVQALIGNINTEINKANTEALKPLLNPYGGISPNQLPFGPVMDRQGNTINQTNNTTINIDGSQQPDEILGTIEDHINSIFRSASMSQPSEEK